VACFSSGGRPIGEGVDEELESPLAATWQAARAAGQTMSSWGGQRAGRHGSNNGAAGATRDNSSNVGSQFQLSFSADGTQQHSSADGGVLRKQDTWVSSAGAEDVGARASMGAAGRAAQQHEAAAVKFLAKHGFMVDDLVGDEHALAVQRSRWHILLLHVVSIVQRCLTAIMLGLYHFSYVSVKQAGLLISFHAVFILYLISIRPFASRLLLLSDMLAYFCELTVLAVAMVLQANPSYNKHQQLTRALIACYFFDVAAMIVPEVLRYILMAWAWVQARRLRQQPAQEHIEPGRPVKTRSRRGSGKASAAAAGGDGVVMVAKHTGDDKDAAAAKAAAAAALKLSGAGGR